MTASPPPTVDLRRVVQYDVCLGVSALGYVSWDFVLDNVAYRVWQQTGVEVRPRDLVRPTLEGVKKEGSFVLSRWWRWRGSVIKVDPVPIRGIFSGVRE